MRDSDWSRQNLLRSDWLPPIVASITTIVNQRNQQLGVHPYCCHLLVVKQCL